MVSCDLDCPRDEIGIIEVQPPDLNSTRALRQPTPIWVGGLAPRIRCDAPMADEENSHTETQNVRPCPARSVRARLACIALRSALGSMAVALAGFSGLALSAPGDPRVPPGRHPDGLVVGFVTTGIDYRVPEIAARLARDGEGELIGWDLVDDDRTPFGAVPADPHLVASGDATADTHLLQQLIAEAAGGPDLAFVPVRVEGQNPVSIAKAIAFLARTPAQYVIVPMWSASREDWEPFQKAAARFPHVRLLLSNCPDRRATDGSATYPRDLALANAVSVVDNTYTDDAGSLRWTRPLVERPCETRP